MNPSHYSYWEKDSFLKPYDLVVIGAGIVGLSTALFFSKSNPEARIMVVDKGFIPEGASTRNAGFACVGSITEHVADLERESESRIKERIVTRYEGLKLLRKTLGEKPIGFDLCGGYELFVEEEEFQEAAGYIGQFNTWMSELVGEQDVYSAAELHGYKVIHNKLEGALHPGKMMQQLLLQVTRRDVEVRWNAEVKKLYKTGGVELKNGMDIQADQILVASNGFTQKILSDPDVEIKPARGYVLVSNEQKEMPWRGTFHYDCGYLYFRDIGDRLLLGGARNMAIEEEETDEFGTNPTIKSRLINFADEVLHLPDSWEVEYEWSGIMGFTESKTPVLKRLNRNQVVAAGLSGMGIAIGMEIGKRAAALLNDK